MAARGGRPLPFDSRDSPTFNYFPGSAAAVMNRMNLQHSESSRPDSVGSSHSNTSGHGPKPHQDICVGEELRIAVDIALEKFRMNEEQKELEFPSSLTATERAYIHRLSQSLGLKSKSKGKGTYRYLTVSKKEGLQSQHSAASFQLLHNSRHQIRNLIQRFPVTTKEKLELTPRTERSMVNEGMKELNKTTTGRLNNGVSQVPPKRGDSDLNAFRETLPVYGMKSSIVQVINGNRVVLISGETGSGKTTQVPQMILDDCHQHGKPCRIICTQPRRISALSVAERVATERGEKIGQTVGYQIRLESRVSPKTLLTFCTNGVLLRTLMGGDKALATVTHIIVDEIHERDRFSDFLLVQLKSVLPKFKSLRVILMSAALNTELFINYFNNCPVISVPGSLYNVEEYFLEDVLKLTNHTNKKMEKYRREMAKAQEQQKQLDDWYAKQIIDQDVDKHENEDSELIEDSGIVIEEESGLGQERETLEPWLISEMDQLLSDAWCSGDEEIFTQIFHLIMSENVSVDYAHSETSLTPLMVAAGRGFTSVVEQLLNLGANTNVRACNDSTAIDFAKKFQRNEIIELLDVYGNGSKEQTDEENLLRACDTVSPEDKELLNMYHHSFDDEKVDIDLIMALVQHIQKSDKEGAILVFLPGYDDIVSIRDRILSDDEVFGDSSRYILYMLHSAMQSSDQRRVFKRPAAGVRKIILSTNIAETSITIDDVVFVIDSGKIKEKTFDALTSVTMLKSNWVSKAGALQRKGRAGRCQPGICYHLFSKVRYISLLDYQLPEILRFPLQELCLHTKLLAPLNCPIADFLSRAPEAPPFLVVKNAVDLLKQIDALDNWEDLTELGHHLADLPVEPRYGKMVLYSVVLKCLDPILTIACALAYRSPFLLPSQPSQKRAAAMTKRKFSADTFSDHMALLRAFQAWQKARAEGWEKPFCERNFLSSATMEMIVGMRTQLLGQLRASGFVRARGGGDIRDLNMNSENWSVVKAALVAGLYPNVLRVDKQRLKLTAQRENRVVLHNSSVCNMAPNRVTRSGTNAVAIRHLPTNWLLYEEMSRNNRLATVQCCTAVSPITVAIFGGPAKLPPEANKEVENHTHDGSGDGFPDNSTDSEGEDQNDNKKVTLQMDDWLVFKVDPEAASLALQLRQKWHSLFLRRMRAPAKPWSQVDESIIRAIINVLTSEEQALGLQQPAGIGQRPRPMSTESSMHDSSRRSSTDYEQSDDSSDSRSAQRGTRKTHTSPKKRDYYSRLDDRSDNSGPGSRNNSSPSSANNSATNSLRGSASNSPCASPQPSSPSKWPDKEQENAVTHACRYFVMKCNNHRNLDVSINKQIWCTSPSNEKRLNKLFKEGKTVYLIFSVQGSGHFQGFARLTSESNKERPQEFSGMGLGGAFSVEWGKRANLPFQQTHHLLNPWNESKRVQISRDGQEIEPNIGEQLVKLWDRYPDYRPRTSPPSRSGFPSGRGGSSDSRYHRSPGHGGGTDLKKGSPEHGQSSGQWSGSKGGQRGPNFGGQTSHMYNNPPGHHPTSQFNPLYITPVVSPGQMMPQGSSGGMMVPPGASLSPAQGMSPVMILQRGSPTQRPGQQGYSTPPQSMSPHPQQAGQK